MRTFETETSLVWKIVENGMIWYRTRGHGAREGKHRKRAEVLKDRGYGNQGEHN